MMLRRRRISIALTVLSITQGLTACGGENSELDSTESDSSANTWRRRRGATPAPTAAPVATSTTTAPTWAPTSTPTSAPRSAPTSSPTSAPTAAPTPAPTTAPTKAPTAAPTSAPTAAPTPTPTAAPTSAPSVAATSFFPAWLTAPAGQWAQIPDTLAPSQLADYSGVALRDDDSGVELFAALAGGHGGNNTDNAVRTLQLNDGAPRWVTRRAASSTAGSSLSGSQAYYTADGRPMPRHTYHDIVWVPEIGRYLVGGMYWGTAGLDFQITDAFAPSGTTGGDWDPKGSFPQRPKGAGGYLVMLSVRNPATGMYYGTTRSDGSYLHTFNPRSKTWGTVVMSGSGNVNMGGNAFDTRRGLIYNLSNGSWFVPAAGVHSTTIDPTTGVKTTIGFNASAAWSDFQSKASQFVMSALEYDEDADCYYFYNGNTFSLAASEGAKVYRITPNSTSTWDMSIVSTTGVTPALESGGGSGVATKFRFIRRWRTLIMVSPGRNVYYLRLPS